MSQLEKPQGRACTGEKKMLRIQQQRHKAFSLHIFFIVSFHFFLSFFLPFNKNILRINRGASPGTSPGTGATIFSKKFAKAKIIFFSIKYALCNYFYAKKVFAVYLKFKLKFKLSYILLRVLLWATMVRTERFGLRELPAQ